MAIKNFFIAEQFYDSIALDVSTQSRAGMVTISVTTLHYPDKISVVAWTYQGKKDTFRYAPAEPNDGERSIEHVLDDRVSEAINALRVRGLALADARPGLRSFGIGLRKFYAGKAAEILNASGAIVAERDFLSTGESESHGPQCDTASLYAVGTRKRLTNDNILRRIKTYFLAHPNELR